MFFFMFVECLILVGQGREFQEFSKDHIKFLCLSRVICLCVGQTRQDEADYYWVACLQQVPSVKNQEKEEEQYEMLVQVSPNGKSQEIWPESLIPEPKQLLMDMNKDENAEYGNLVKSTGPVLLWR